jgi:hypothetical protein
VNEPNIQIYFILFQGKKFIFSNIKPYLKSFEIYQGQDLEEAITFDIDCMSDLYNAADFFVINLNPKAKPHVLFNTLISPFEFGNSYEQYCNTKE